MKALVCLISLLIIAGCQQSSESGYTTTGQNVGTGTLQDVHKDDAKFLLPRTFATSLHKARWMSSKQHYQEAVEASHEEVSYSVSFVYVPSGGFARQTSTASYQGLFKGLKKIDPEIDSSNLIPEFVGDVRAADLMVGNKTCITFVRVLGKVISGAFGVDGPAYASGVACGGADMSFGQVRAKAIPQIASFKFRERSPGSGTVVETKASPTR